MSSLMSKRAVLVAPDQPIEVWEAAMTDPKPGEVVVKVQLGGVCGTDVHFWRGEVPLPGPMVLGHEGIGTVEKLGQGVATDYAGQALSEGDRVYWMPFESLSSLPRLYGRAGPDALRKHDGRPYA